MIRLDTDPRLVLTGADCEAIERGAAFTPTDLTVLTRLLRWVQTHDHHAHMTPDGRICIGIATHHLGDNAWSTSLAYVRTHAEARDALGY